MQGYDSQEAWLAARRLRRREWLIAGLLTVVGAGSVAVYWKVLWPALGPLPVLFLCGTEVLTLVFIYLLVIRQMRRRPSGPK